MGTEVLSLVDDNLFLQWRACTQGNTLGDIAFSWTDPAAPDVKHRQDDEGSLHPWSGHHRKHQLVSRPSHEDQCLQDHWWTTRHFTHHPGRLHPEASCPHHDYKLYWKDCLSLKPHSRRKWKLACAPQGFLSMHIAWWLLFSRVQASISQL